MMRNWILMLICLLAGLNFLAASPAAAQPETNATGTKISLDGSDWLVAPDTNNAGRKGQWWNQPTPDAKQVRVPGIFQEVLLGHHGVAWYWKDVVIPANPYANGRNLLRFWQAEYLADVWVNGVHVGQHEGGEDPFTLDITKAVKPGESNRIAVRIVNPTGKPLEGLELGEIPHRNRCDPMSPGSDFNFGGLTDSVELMLVPPVRVADLFVRPDAKTGVIRVQATLENTLAQAADGRIQFTVAPARDGETLNVSEVKRSIPAGQTVVEANLTVEHPRLWDLNDSYMYRVTASFIPGDSKATHELSTRCGFRDFRFANGAFQLNGRRIFLKSSHTGADVPVGVRVPLDPDILRRDLLNCKVMGFNMIRFIAGTARRYQLELCDEIGLMVYEESFSAWGMGWNLSDPAKMGSEAMRKRFDHSTTSMIQRDRNHPSIVMWGLLNENFGDAIFQHALKCLPLVNSFDDSRMVVLNSGRLDGLTREKTQQKLEGWTEVVTFVPNVMRNTQKTRVDFDGSSWEPGQLTLHPGTSGEYSVIRWTAPGAGEYSFKAMFSGRAAKPTTSDIHVFHNGAGLLDGFINLKGQKNEVPFERVITCKQGDTFDFVVGPGNGDPYSDTTALDLKIAPMQSIAPKEGAGKVYDVAADFTTKKIPGSAWSYGLLPATQKPEIAKFKTYDRERSSTSAPIGGMVNPGGLKWEDILSDQHKYQGVPHYAPIMTTLRTLEGQGLPVFLSEYGVGSGLDLAKLARHYEQLGRTDCEDAKLYHGYLDKFMADWTKWKMEDTFASPEDYFRQVLAKMAGQRALGIDAIRSNPNMIGYSVTGTQDQGYTGEGLTTTFRDLKPGTLDAVFESFYPLRWCMFAEPLNAFPKRPIKLEAVLANEDALKPGDYPARVQVVGPDGKRVMDKTIIVKVPDRQAGPAFGFAIPAFSEDIVINGPSGKYRFLIAFQKGGAASGGELVFNVADPTEAALPKAEVVVWGEDQEILNWLKAIKVNARPFQAGAQTAREVIVATYKPAAGDVAAWRDLATRIARGSTVVFVCPEIFKRGDDQVGWLPLEKKGRFAQMEAWVYHKDEWAKAHPIFEGMPTGLMDYTTWRDIIRDKTWADQDAPEEVVAGGIDTSLRYTSGLMLQVNKLGAGRFITNTMWLRENLNKCPWADRIILNMINYAARDAGKPLAELPPDFEAQLKRLGY